MLKPFAALCGFLPLPIVPIYASSTPELAALFPPPITEHFHQLTKTADADPSAPDARAAVRDVFAAVMTVYSVLMHEQLAALTTHYAAGVGPSQESEVVELALTLMRQLSGDVGDFCRSCSIICGCSRAKRLSST